MQGSWTERDYLDLEWLSGDNLRIELTAGRLEMLPASTELHQEILRHFLIILGAFVETRQLGKVSFAGIRVRLRGDDQPVYRQPDLAFMTVDHAARRHNEFWEGADLVMEIVSGDRKDRQRDYVEKKREYAEAGVAEYWIVDPDDRVIQVLTLDNGVYRLHGEFRPGQNATSVLLREFAVTAALQSGD